MATYISPEQRAKIISAIKDEGMSIPDAAKTYLITEDTIRTWLSLHLGINKKRVLRIMHLYKLYPLVARRRRRKRDSLPSAIPYRIKDLSLTQPNQVWVGDFTYLWYCGRHVYLGGTSTTTTPTAFTLPYAWLREPSSCSIARQKMVGCNPRPEVSDVWGTCQTEVHKRLLELWDLPPDLYEKVAREFPEPP